MTPPKKTDFTQGMSNSPDGIQAGGDVTINEAPLEQPLPHWLDRSGGPQFDRLHPGRDGIDSPVLLCEFEIDADPQPNRVEARWVGAGTESIWVSPMREASNKGATYRKFQMKPTRMNPNSSTEEVKFQVRFMLVDGEHGGSWTWPLVKHQKGHWDLQADQGSGVRQPIREDTW